MKKTKNKQQKPKWFKGMWYSKGEVVTNPYTGEEVEVSLAHSEPLQRYDTKALSRLDSYSVYLQTGDEVLDYKKAMWMYQGCYLHVEQGGSHQFDGFESHLEDMMNFLNLT